MFFFSSRRRHTRWTGDWSSDVCSSDLRVAVVAAIGDGRGPQVGAHRPVTDLRGRFTRDDGDRTARRIRRIHIDIEIIRSEERRVGKECKYREVPDHVKRKK